MAIVQLPSDSSFYQIPTVMPSSKMAKGQDFHCILLYCTEVALALPNINLHCAACTKYLGIKQEKRMEQCNMCITHLQCCQAWSHEYWFDKYWNQPDVTMLLISLLKCTALFYQWSWGQNQSQNLVQNCMKVGLLLISYLLRSQNRKSISLFGH